MAKPSEIFGKNLRLLIESTGFTQAELARKAGVTGAQISLYVNDEAAPTLRTAERIAEALGVSLADLIGADRPAHAAPRKATSEELAYEMLRRFGIDKNRLEIIRFALEGKDSVIQVLLRQLPAIEGRSAAGKGTKGASGA